MHTIKLRHSSVVRATFGLAFALVAGCAAETVSEPEDVVGTADVGETQQAVIGGQPAADCQWSSTVRVDPAQCTGTLIHPRIVATAAHCMTGTTATIGFGNRGAPGGFSVSARCVAGARGSSGGNTGRDWAYCVLPEDPRIAKITPTPPLVGCEAAMVKPGSSAWVVGYGSTSPRGPVGPKRQVEVKINQFNKLAPGTIDVGDRQSGACHGDSGGPLYVRLIRDGVDYGLRTMGSTSGAGGNCDCTCSTTYVNIENHVKAIEKNEGIDVTPCTDADGKWDPSPACSGFESAPESGAGKFPECTVVRTTSPIESCGPGTTGGADAGTDAGASSRADGGANAGTNSDAGTVADAGAGADGGTSNDGGARKDGGARPYTTDAGDGGRVRDAGSRDAGKRDEATDSDEDESDDSEEGTSRGNKAPAESGCSAMRARGGLETLSLALFALVLGRVRRRRS